MDFHPQDDDWPPITKSKTSQIPNTEFEFNRSVHYIGTGLTSYPRHIIPFDDDLANDVYVSLLNHAGKHCYAFSLVWRDQLDFSEQAISLRGELARWQCFERYTSTWRGTKLFGSKAWVRWYRITPDTLLILKRANSLYSWRSPDYPEDLAFYCQNGKGWVGSTSHEKVGWLDLEAIDELLIIDLLKLLSNCNIVSYNM